MNSAATLSPQATTVPKHLDTWAFDEYWGAGSNGTKAQAQTYLTYAEGGYGNSKAVDDCGGSNACHSVFYYLNNFVLTNGACSQTFASGAMSESTESWFLHQPGYTDSAHRLVGYRTLNCDGVLKAEPVYALNYFNSAARTYDLSYLRTYANSWDYYLMDETSGLIKSQFYGPGGGMCRENPFPYLCTTTQEYPYDSTLLQAHHDHFAGLTHTNGTPMNVFFNGITFSSGQASDLGIITQTGNVVGVMCEDCVVSHGTFRPEMYASVLNGMAQVSALSRGAFVQLNIGEATPGSSEEIEERTITAAMTWLGYSPGHTIVFPDLESNSKDLAIWPEYSIVPTSPIQTMSTSFSALQVATRVYRREFRACYNWGTLIGPCAAIVNGLSTSSITVAPSWLSQTYYHKVQLVGGDIQSGGRAVFNVTPFVPATTTIAPGHAVLLVR